MPTLFEKLMGRSHRDQQDQLDAKILSYRSVLMQSALEALGQKIAKPIDEQAAFDVMKAADPSIDAPRTIDRIKQRISQAAKAARINELKKAAESAEAARQLLLEKQREAARLMREQYPDLNAAAVRAVGEYAAAVAAEQELIATAETSAKDSVLSSQLTEVGRAIDACKSRLNRLGGALTSHVASAHHARELLRNTANMQPKRIAELQRQLEFAEKGIVEATKELVDLEKQRDEIHAKYVKLEADKLRPENFAIVRRKPAHSAATLIGAMA